MTRKSLRDCSLTMLGFEQAVWASQFANQLKVHTVYTSPLVRAIETAYFLFKDHPDKPTLKIVPLMREHLHSVCDIPSSIKSIEERFKKGEMKIDFSLFEEYGEEREHWFINTY
jgi:broad specificity phosphatase PhoE